MIFKRTLAKIIDIFIPFCASGFGYYIAYESKQGSRINEIVSIWIFMCGAYVLTTFFSLIISNGKTLGESFLKMKAVKLNNNNLSLIRIYFKELYFSFFLFMLFSTTNGWIPFIINVLPTIKLKGDNQLLMLIDVLFGLKYIDTD